MVHPGTLGRKEASLVSPCRSREIESARAANSVFTLPLVGRVGALSALRASSTRYGAGVGVVRWSADGPPPPTPLHKGEGSAPSCPAQTRSQGVHNMLIVLVLAAI